MMTEQSANAVPAESMPDGEFLQLVHDMLESYSAMSAFVIDCRNAAPISPKRNRKEWEYAAGQALKAMTGCRAIVELLEPELNRRMSAGFWAGNLGVPYQPTVLDCPADETGHGGCEICGAQDHDADRHGACPRPCNGRPDGFTVAECVAAGECGCSDGATVSAAPAKLIVCESCGHVGERPAPPALSCCPERKPVEYARRAADRILVRLGFSPEGNAHRLKWVAEELDRYRFALHNEWLDKQADEALATPGKAG